MASQEVRRLEQESLLLKVMAGDNDACREFRSCYHGFLAHKVEMYAEDLAARGLTDDVIQEVSALLVGGTRKLRPVKDGGVPMRFLSLLVKDGIRAVRSCYGVYLQKDPALRTAKHAATPSEVRAASEPGEASAAEVIDLAEARRGRRGRRYAALEVMDGDVIEMQVGGDDNDEVDRSGADAHVIDFADELLGLDAYARRRSESGDADVAALGHIALREALGAVTEATPAEVQQALILHVAEDVSLRHAARRVGLTNSKLHYHIDKARQALEARGIGPVITTPNATPIPTDGGTFVPAKIATSETLPAPSTVA